MRLMLQLHNLHVFLKLLQLTAVESAKTILPIVEERDVLSASQARWPLLPTDEVRRVQVQVQMARIALYPLAIAAAASVRARKGRAKDEAKTVAHCAD